MKIQALNFPKFNNVEFNNIQAVQPVQRVASNPFEKAGLKLNADPSLLENPQAKVRYLA